MKAHAPGSVTGMFAPPVADSPSARSRGASFAVEDGVVAEVHPTDRTAIRVDGEEVEFAPVTGVLNRLGVTAAVDLDPSVPLGAGFGASGAATLATAIAANAAFDLGHTRDELVEAAHRAEVAAGTGLGDVFIQADGGLVWSIGAGDERATAPLTDRVEYVSFGPIETSEVLADDDFVARVREIGTRTIDQLPEDPSMRTFTALSWRFARETGLVTDRIAAEVEQIRESGGEASMAMLGETVFAIGVNDALPEATRVSPEGARLLDE